VSFAAITLCVACQWVIPKVSVYFVIDSVRKLSDTPSYIWSLAHLRILHIKAHIPIQYVKNFLLKQQILNFRYRLKYEIMLFRTQFNIKDSFLFRNSSFRIFRISSTFVMLRTVWYVNKTPPWFRYSLFYCNIFYELWSILKNSYSSFADRHTFNGFLLLLYLSFLCTWPSPLRWWVYGYKVLVLDIERLHKIKNISNRRVSNSNEICVTLSKDFVRNPPHSRLSHYSPVDFWIQFLNPSSIISKTLHNSRMWWYVVEWGVTLSV
jgi:hypothetical protein